MNLAIEQFPCLSDNYGYLIRDEKSGMVATIDTPDVEAINAHLARLGWQLNTILNTHHHWDHAGGNLALKEKWNCQIIGPRAEAARIPGIDREVGEGDVVCLGASTAIVRDTPGHTSGHIIYHFEDNNCAFVGDTIFALGCGRLFEGTPEQMWASLSKIRAMPACTRLYCAHEYTAANARFAVTIEPDNADLQARLQQVNELRARDIPTVPTSVGEELATSPFLRADQPGVKQALAMEQASDVEVFAEIRRRKDNF